MFRKSLFLGLTVMLAAAIVYLLIQGRRQEKQAQAPRPVEIFRESPPSLTRVIAPDDLDIVESKMALGAPGAGADQIEPAGVAATHRLVVRNSGRAAYRNLALKLSYIGRGEKVLETRMVQAAELLLPGQARSISEIKVENVPAGAIKCLAKIAYADLEPSFAKP